MGEAPLYRDQRSEWEQIVLFEPPDLYRSPDSGELPYKSRKTKTAL